MALYKYLPKYLFWVKQIQLYRNEVAILSQKLYRAFRCLLKDVFDSNGLGSLVADTTWPPILFSQFLY